MEIIKITQIKFGSFIKLTCLTFLQMGIFFGIFMFVQSLIGGEVKTNLGPFVLEGIPGGLAGIIVGPVVFGILGLISGFIAYIPVKLMLKILKGISLREKLDGSTTNDDLDKE